MSPEEKRLLERSVSLGEENNKMLHSMRRSARWASFFRAIYWILIIGSAVGAYYFIQPYVDQMVNVYSGAQSNLNDVNKIIQSFKK
ncbi:MAG: hypothetical protein UR90_C0016G0014 [Parcubacteria group bacterium GW2011_GWC1_35_8]|uniref:Uncharacterized protein n=2 Tax=Candidatus Nomuraibacteriota TaxID=1752729 RepID=A0A1F6YRY6_9BACT|nr:MAG: hypothetical protein UR90_C0016G0014 [Parcubacteria group bacterium GW2011_GWC1_35_8]KKP88397.1 MAG: hypothetical protein UR91_C0019G0002 [Candidatus Nomurabacteria bacterium GW2011_GWC2_35_8]OGJ05060.1 MAG: hypothetical protein A2238_00095 [Candidatus Nomurabacteria bacterium RIFOXYA2_FULL_35_9]OGJ09142.1 MAG: hypothetical protein A2456_02075 [Candidatus Nomurabacteria bacterium RIFOXYC2_FULL_36_19]OGJ14218.1 MAG: hypothetical protein A2554_01650 [Candidatus Nomurabacteria bacterium RI